MKILTSEVRPDLKVWEVLICVAIMGGYCYIGGSNIEKDKQEKIIHTLQEEYNTLQTQYERDLSTCRTLLSDIQNRVQKGEACYVDGGLNCE